jgi:hypothetical protein
MSDYKGWTNRETWAAWVHISNNETYYNLCKGWNPAEMGRDLGKALSDPNPNDRFQVVAAEDIGNISRVNWNEIAAAFATN